MELVALPAFDDNYIWMFHDGRQAVVVDPGAAVPVRAALVREGLDLAGILVTHHHGDHVGGLDELLAHHPAPVWGPPEDRLPVPAARRVCLAGGEGFTLLGLQIEVIAVPGHTRDHLAYLLPAQPGLDTPWLFCGDTLFSAGCGRLFEGTPAQMHASLTRLAALPDPTLVCCAHEYTLANLRFALAVEPGNTALLEHQRNCEALRAAQRPTLPSRIALERRINPYLRCDQPGVTASAAARGANPTDPVAVFAAIRAWKNQFQ